MVARNTWCRLLQLVLSQRYWHDYCGLRTSLTRCCISSLMTMFLTSSRRLTRDVRVEVALSRCSTNLHRRRRSSCLWNKHNKYRMYYTMYCTYHVLSSFIHSSKLILTQSWSLFTGRSSTVTPGVFIWKQESNIVITECTLALHSQTAHCIYRAHILCWPHGALSTTLWAVLQRQASLHSCSALSVLPHCCQHLNSLQKGWKSPSRPTEDWERHWMPTRSLHMGSEWGRVLCQPPH